MTNAGHDAYINLAERIEDAFSKIDNDICVDLRGSDAEYAEMWRETLKLQREYPVIPQVIHGEGKVSLSAEEHKALVRYLSLKNEMKNIERKQIYFRCHMDNYAFLKKIGAV